MDCKQWNDDWIAYLYDECSAEEHETVERHLAGCGSCRARMDGLEATRRAMREAAPAVVAPPRVIVLPAPARRATASWGFAAGLAAAAVFAFGMFIGMEYFSTEKTVVEMADGEDIPMDSGAVPAVDEGYERFENGIREVRNDYVDLDNRLGRIERFMPEAQGDQAPRLLTEDRLQLAVGNLSQEFDVIRTHDLQLFVQALYAAEQTARQRDVTLSQAIELMNAEYNPRVRQR